MSSPDPVPRIVAPPSASTVATGLSGGITVLVIWLIGLKGVVVPPEIAATLTMVISTLIGYFPKSGRARPDDAKTRASDVGGKS
jgi:hypothetical protein